MRTNGRWLVATGLLLAAGVSRAGDVATLLAQAEVARTSDPARFESTLARLDALRAAATPAETRQLTLLGAYRDTLRGRYDAAITSLVALHREAPETVLRFRSALLIANTAAITRDFTLGLRYLDHALALEDRIVDKDVRLSGYGVAALLYNQHAQYALAQKYAELVLAQDPVARTRCAARQFRIEAVSGLGGTVDLAELERAVDDCESQHETIASNLIRGYQARQWVAQGRVQQAITLLETHLPEVEATRYPRLIGEMHGLLAQYRFATGDRDGARRDAVAALATEKPGSFSQPLVAAHRVLYEIALELHQFERALREYRAYAEADKARLDEVKAREIAFQITRNELQQKNQSIALLKQQNEVLQLEQKVAKASTQNTRLLIALLAVLLAGGLIWAVRARRTHHSLRRLADTDGLTGISNRRHFRAQAEAAFAQCGQRGQPVAMLLFDLDHFKQINDRHGHGTGDWVLQEVSKCCAARCRKGDLFGRVGGEEFALALLDCDLAAAREIGESLRRCIESIDTSPTGQSFRVSASFGCAGSARSGHVYETLCANADTALYRAKNAGRNCVDVHEGARPAAAADCPEHAEALAEA